ncbi:hypothetical protein D3C78_1682860 [compost metagenome]
MILGQIGEARSPDGHTVQTALLDAVRRGLQLQMRHLLGGQFGQQAGGVGGVGAGQAGAGQGVGLVALLTDDA